MKGPDVNDLAREGKLPAHPMEGTERTHIGPDGQSRRGAPPGEPPDSKVPWYYDSRGVLRPGHEPGSPDEHFDDVNVEMESAPRVRVKGRPTISVTTEIADVVDQALGALASDAGVYQRDGYLVHVVRTTDAEATDVILAGTPQIRRVAPATMLERLTRVALWERTVKRKDQFQTVAALPPPAVVQAALARGEYPSIRSLVGILEAPSIRADGRPIQDAGYDKVTRYLYVPAEPFPRVPEAPTQADASRARELLEEVVADFPFERPALGRSVFVAALLSILARPAIRGSCPGFVHDANVRGSGKTLLADVLGIITTGRPAGRMTFTSDEAELEKILASFALRGAALVCFDNVTRLGGEPLDKVLTAVDLVDLRVLGKSEIASLPWRAIVLATGNNVEVMGDTSRRVVVERLDCGEERPEDRTDFRHADLRAWVRQHRADLVVAALTVLRAWFVAGRPGGGLRPWGSFESWSAIVPPAIVFAGGVDPMLARPEAAGAMTTEGGALSALVEGWARLAPAGGLTAKAALDVLYTVERLRGSAAPDGHDDLREAIEALVATVPGKPPTSARLGYALRRFRRRVVGGRMLDSQPDRNGVARWQVVTRGRTDAGDAGDAGDVSNPSRGQEFEEQDPGGSRNIPRDPPHPPQGFLDDLAEMGIGGRS